MSPGQIVIVDWRDAYAGSFEPNKRRPGIVVGAASFFGVGVRFNIIVPMTGDASLAIPDASTLIEPTAENGCAKRSYALAWSVQTVPEQRVTETSSSITTIQLHRIRRQIAACLDAL